MQQSANFISKQLLQNKREKKSKCLLFCRPKFYVCVSQSHVQTTKFFSTFHFRFIKVINADKIASALIGLIVFFVNVYYIYDSTSVGFLTCQLTVPFTRTERVLSDAQLHLSAGYFSAFEKWGGADEQRVLHTTLRK